jgi:hypothetical protein
LFSDIRVQGDGEKDPSACGRIVPTEKHDTCALISEAKRLGVKWDIVDVYVVL